MLKFSKRAHVGLTVVKSGDRYIRASRRSRRIAGVVQAESIQRVITDKGLVTVRLPRGIVVYGPVQVSIVRR